MDNALGCNRLENAVKPQHMMQQGQMNNGCNRLENAVKPQHIIQKRGRGLHCNRLENAVKPQLNTFLTHANESYIGL